MLRAYKYRLYPTRLQEIALQQSFGCARWSYNWALETRIKHYAETGKTLSAYDLNKLMTYVKKEHTWLNNVSDWVLKEAIANCCAAFQRFFEGNAAFPKFKTKRKSKKSATFRRMRVEGNHVKLSKIGSVKFVKHREFTGEIKRITVSQNCSGAYYVSFLVEDGVSKKVCSATPVKGVGIDVGITHFCALSTGEVIENPKYFDKAQKKLAREQRKLSRKERGSSRYEKQRIKVARAYEHVANQRKDFQHKLSKRLVDENQVIAVEDLCIEGMLHNHKLACSIFDCAWSQFLSFLEYKCDWYGSDYLKCGRFEASSKVCSRCGHVEAYMPLARRRWVCPSCNTEHDRDVNAALNILKFAVAGTVNGRGGDVRRTNMQRYNAVLQYANSYEASSL